MLQIIQLVKILRMLRIFKLLKAINFTQLTNQLEDNLGLSASFLSLLRTMTLLIFGSHLVACFWWGVTANGAIDDPNHWYNMPIRINPRTLLTYIISLLPHSLRTPLNAPSHPLSLVLLSPSHPPPLSPLLLSPSHPPPFPPFSFHPLTPPPSPPFSSHPLPPPLSPLSTHHTRYTSNNVYQNLEESPFQDQYVAALYITVVTLR